MSYVTLNRNSGLMGMFRDISFLMDGRKLIKIGRNSSKTVEIDPGSHFFQISMDWMKTEPIEVNVGKNEEIVFECGTGMGAVLVGTKLKIRLQLTDRRLRN
nr:hypothetical protein [Rhodoferax sp.]